jgi:hypothetical protein
MAPTPVRVVLHLAALPQCGQLDRLLDWCARRHCEVVGVVRGHGLLHAAAMVVRGEADLILLDTPRQLAPLIVIVGRAERVR